MDFYYFGSRNSIHKARKIENHLYSGLLVTYDATQGDHFTTIASEMHLTKKLKYMVAIRPYAMSPQYLCMINQSMNLISPNRTQINLITGHIKEHEKTVGGIIGNVTDSSSAIDRSEYLLEYVDILNNMNTNLDFYVSTTNDHIFKKIKDRNNKMIVEYTDYISSKMWKVDDKYHPDFGKIVSTNTNFSFTGTSPMLCLSPVLRNTQEELELLDKTYRPEGGTRTRQTMYYTYDQFETFIHKLEKEGIKELLLVHAPESEIQILMDFVKQYKQKELITTDEN
jgi:hypothetical protein